MEKDELASRWGAVDIGRLGTVLLSGGSIDSKTLPELALNEGRLDLRGIELPARGLTAGITVGTAFSPLPPIQNKVKSVVFDSVDFSYANLSGRWIQDSKFHDVLFLKSNLERVSIHATLFSECVFDRTRFRGSGVGYNSSRYEHCVFTRVNFEKTSFACAEFDDCSFENCRLNNVDFSGSSFERCVFRGKVHDVWFRGHYMSVPGKPQIYEDFVKKFGAARSNSMKDVDFTEADLSNLTFSDECDLSSCRIPHDEYVQKFSKWPEVLSAVEARIPYMFTLGDGEVLEDVKAFDAHALSQKWFIVNFRDFSKYLSANVVERLKELFIEEARKIGAL